MADVIAAERLVWQIDSRVLALCGWQFAPLVDFRSDRDRLSVPGQDALRSRGQGPVCSPVTLPAISDGNRVDRAGLFFFFFFRVAHLLG